MTSATGKSATDGGAWQRAKFSDLVFRNNSAPGVEVRLPVEKGGDFYIGEQRYVAAQQVVEGPQRFVTLYEAGFRDAIEAAAKLCERERCRNWDSKECAEQIRDPQQIPIPTRGSQTLRTAADERADVVAWLRNRAPWFAWDSTPVLNQIAEDVEAGKHVGASKKEVNPPKPTKVKCPTCRCRIDDGSVCACCAASVSMIESRERQEYAEARSEFDKTAESIVGMLRWSARRGGCPHICERRTSTAQCWRSRLRRRMTGLETPAMACFICPTRRNFSWTTVACSAGP